MHDVLEGSLHTHTLKIVDWLIQHEPAVTRVTLDNTIHDIGQEVLTDTGFRFDLPSGSFTEAPAVIDSASRHQLGVTGIYRAGASTRLFDYTSPLFFVSI